MNNKLQSFLDRYDKLPPEIREALFSAATADKVFEIGKKHGLLIDKVGILSSEIGMLMIGITHPREFVGSLSISLNLSANDARKIAHDINMEILAPLHDHLLKLHNMAESEKISYADGPGMSIGMPTPVDSDNIKPRIVPSSFDDIKIQLQHIIERENGGEPAVKTVPIQTVATPAAITATPPVPDISVMPKPTYKSIDPYRESPEEAPFAEIKMESSLSASLHNKIAPATPSKFSFGSLRKDAPEKMPESVPTPTPYRSGVFQKRPQNSPFEEMQQREAESKPIPQAPAPAPSAAEAPAKGHVTTPGGFRGFRMSEGGNLAHLREQTSEAVAAPYSLPRSTPAPAPTVRIPVVAPAPTEQDIAKKGAVKPISQQSSSSDAYREPLQ